MYDVFLKQIVNTSTGRRGGTGSDVEGNKVFE